jgi:hypothetical protein
VSEDGATAHDGHMSEPTVNEARFRLAYLGWLIELAEDVVDAEAAREAREEMADTGVSTTPWEQVRVDLSLT